mmetsp:Transcript_25937/g.56914  ORF Transcript_25937/g.56914 Transcript_25937/m.56914 type:complete len:388 (+) Transcript_25937:45-1208(+)
MLFLCILVISFFEAASGVRGLVSQELTRPDCLAADHIGAPAWRLYVYPVSIQDFNFDHPLVATYGKFLTGKLLLPARHDHHRVLHGESHGLAAAAACMGVLTQDVLEADLYFVPISGQLLCEAAAHVSGRPVEPLCTEYQVVLRWTAQQEAWRRWGGRDHIFVLDGLSDAQAVRVGASALQIASSIFLCGSDLHMPPRSALVQPQEDMRFAAMTALSSFVESWGARTREVMLGLHATPLPAASQAEPSVTSWTHVVFAVDEERLSSFRATLASVLAHANHPHALALHVFSPAGNGSKATLQNLGLPPDGIHSNWMLPCGAVLKVHEFDPQEVATRFNAEGSQPQQKANSWQQADPHRFTNPSNFARFLVDDVKAIGEDETSTNSHHC